jgi:putative ABC transport system permease protein
MPLGKLSWREIQGRPLRSLLTLLSIVIGVSAIVATSLASNSAQLAQVAMVQSVTGRASLEIEGIGGASMDGKPLEFVAGLEGVEVASPILRRFSNMQIVSGGDEKEPTADPERKVPKSFRVQLMGVIPELDRQVRGYTVLEGKELTNDASDKASILMDIGFAASARIQVGTQVKLLTRSFGQTATVIGLIKAKDASAGLQSGLVVAQLSTVQRWSQANGKLDAVQIVLTQDKKPSEMISVIAKQLPEGVKVREPSLRSQISGESTVAMQQGLRLATASALLIAAFIIYNTFQMNVGERRRQLGILRSMGALRKQLLWMIVREGLWLGVVGVLIGCVVGNLGARVLNQSTAKLLQISIPPSPWTFWPYFTAAIAGLVVAFLGAFFPALRASRLSPAEAMRVVASGEFGTSRVGWLVFGSTMITIGIIVQICSVAGFIDVGHAITGATAMVIGIVFLLPGVIDQLTRTVSWCLSPFLKTEAALARRQIMRHRGRSSLTIGIVFIAMSFGSGMASTILDFIGNVEGWYQRAIIGDFFIRAAMPDMNSGQAADMPNGLTDQVSAMAGVAMVDTLRFVRARTGTNSVIVVVRKFNSPEQDYFDLIEGNEAEVMAGIRKGEVVLGSVLSQRLNLHAGDRIPLETNEGATELRIAGVTNEYIAGGLTLYLEAENAKRLMNVDGTDVIVVRSEKGQIQSVDRQLRALCDETGLMFQSYADLVKIIRDTLNGVTGGLWSVLILGSIIAAFGLINTLAMNILEQTREIGMLRVVAMTRAQVRKMILSQALIMGLIGIVPGVFTGIWISYLINLTTMQVTGHDVQFRIYPWLLGGGLLFELLVVVIAALVPAERAARLNVSTALQYE